MAWIPYSLNTVLSSKVGFFVMVTMGTVSKEEIIALYGVHVLKKKESVVFNLFLFGT